MVMFRNALVLLLLGVTTTSAGASSATLRGSSDDDTKKKDNGVVVLESFDKPKHRWEEQNDPVMGGRSTGTFTIEDGLGKFVGEVVDVPFLQAPGFIQARTTCGETFPDISHCSALQIVAKSNTPYNGYRISFGNAHAPGGKLFAYGYKASFPIKTMMQDDEELPGVVTPEKKKKNGFDVVTLPFENFTDFWDDVTGDPIKTCQDNPIYCPDERTLKNIRRLTLWAEGVAGTISLDVKMIQAVGCKKTSLSAVGTEEEIDDKELDSIMA